MRPIKLKLAAFGSYVEPCELNFETGLRDEKIFLIHGATGAGKTTILDAICYALYGAASGKDREGTMMRSKGVADNVATEVEFTFELGEKTYDIHREIVYRPNRKDNRFSQNAELICGKEVIARQSSNVTAKVKELLGFNVDQFRQIVLLPQGEFRKFLFADAKDRQPVLNALFNADYYKKIEDAIELRFKACAEIFKRLSDDKIKLEAELAGASVDDEALTALATEFDEARKKSAELKTVSDKATEKYHAAKNLAEDFDELSKRNKTLETAKQNLQHATAEFTAAQDEYSKRDAETPTRQELQARIQTLESTKKPVDDLIAKRKALPAAQQALQSAEDALGKLTAEAKRYAAWLDKLKRDRDAVADADKKLDDAKRLVATLKHIAELEYKLSAAKRRVAVAQENFYEARDALERLQKLQLDGSAARLAKNLRDGEPCPVCGSRTHHPLDFGDAIVPTDAEIAEAKAKLKSREDSLDAQKKSASSTEGQLISQRNELQKFPDVPPLAEAEKILSAAEVDAKKLEDFKRRIADGEQRIADKNNELEAANKKLIEATSNFTSLSTAVQQLEQQIPDDYRTNPEQLNRDINTAKKTLRDLETAWNSANKTFRDAGNKKSSCEATFNAAQKAQRELADKLANQTRPDAEDFKILALKAQQNHEEAIHHEDDLKHKFDALKKLAAKLAELDKQISDAQTKLSLWQKLSDVASGKITGKKISFTRYYLRAMFAEVLTEANYRLDKMSGRRYELRQKDAGERATSTAGLNLEIFDEFNGSSRPVATLSGGESFLASLSLALGLAAVVRNNLGGLKLDTIFIDEGFGSLDTETLYFAISTIIKQSGNRLVGIISHVEDLKNQMPVRLEVTKTENGSKARFEYGLSDD